MEGVRLCPVSDDSVPFDFTVFARDVYSKYSGCGEEQFLLPDLYGGETSGTFKALVVLQNPLFPRTQQLWRQMWPTRCATPDEAVRRHREIFFQWALGSAFVDLFRFRAGDPSTAEEFFRRIYVTDIWKDAKDSQHVNIKKADSLGAAFWRSLLQ